MAKLVVLLTILAFQVADFASLYNVNFENDLQIIQNEVQDLSTYLRTSFPDNHQAISTVTWQCHAIAESIQIIINKLHEESLKHHENGEKIFKRLWFSFQEIHTSLQQIALSQDVGVSEIKKQIIVNLELASESLVQMVHVTYNYYPEFRTTLKTILNGFINNLRVIRENFEWKHDESLQLSPKTIAKDIRRFSQKIIYRLKDIVHPDLIKRSLRWYLEQVHGIAQKLEMLKSVGDDEINVILRHITYKCKKLSALGQYEYSVNVEQIFAHFCDIVTLFEQLVQFIENGSQSAHADVFIQKIMYDYFNVVEHTFDMVQNGEHHFDKVYQMGQGPRSFNHENKNRMSTDYFVNRY